MAKTKRMVEGGLDMPAEDDDGYTSENATNARISKALMEDSAEAGPAMTFKQAFRAARGAGNKTFTWNGKKYTTDLAKPAAKPPASTEATSAPAPKGSLKSAISKAVSSPTTDTSGGSMYKGMKAPGWKAGGKVKKMASGGKVRGGGCEQRGKTRGRMV